MSQTVPEKDPWTQIADDLLRVADDLRNLVGEPAPGCFDLNIQPHNPDGPGRPTVKGRPGTVAAVNAVAGALLGKDAETYPVAGGFHHGLRGLRGSVGVSVYTSVADPAAVDPAEEIARLREENERLRAAVPADPTGQLYGRGDEGVDPQPVAGRVPPHLEDGSNTVHLDQADGGSFCGLEPTTPHRGTNQHADVTCSDCIAEAPF